MANNSVADTPRRRPWAAIAVVAVSVLVAAACTSPSAPPPPGCDGDIPSSAHVWSAEWSPPNAPPAPECVGISEGPYTFGHPELQQVFTALEAQNRDTTCTGAAVTIGVPVTLTSPNAVGRARHELEGFVATQAAANADHLCTHPIKLRVGQTGTDQEAATVVATTLAGDGAVALVGMGLSDPKTAIAATAVGGGPKPVPMVADLISAEGFDTLGSAEDHPRFEDCDDSDSYKKGIGNGWFYRVGYRNTKQVRALAAYNNGAPVGFLVKPMLRSDPASCTQLAEYRIQFGTPRELVFSPDDAPQTLKQAASPICKTHGSVRVIYGARSRDLATFLLTLDEFVQNGWCSFDDVTVLAGSDSSRLRAEEPPEPDPDREGKRLAALRTKSVQSGRIKIIQTPLADPDVPAIRASTGYQDLTAQFARLGFAEADVDDGWALNAHDALMTVVDAVGQLPQNAVPTPAQVNAAITDSFAGDPNNPENTVLGAIGQPLNFDNAGNRTGEPAVVRLCGLPADQTPHPRTRTVVVAPGETGDCG